MAVDARFAARGRALVRELDAGDVGFEEGGRGSSDELPAVGRGLVAAPGGRELEPEIVEGVELRRIELDGSYLRAAVSGRTGPTRKVGYDEVTVERPAGTWQLHVVVSDR